LFLISIESSSFRRSASLCLQILLFYNGKEKSRPGRSGYKNLRYAGIGRQPDRQRKNFFKSNYKNPLFAGIGKRERQKGGKLS
jgi:hypothetical protein